MAGGHTTTHEKRGAIFMASLTLRTCCNDNIQGKIKFLPFVSVGECGGPELAEKFRLRMVASWGKWLMFGFIELTLL
jgi:hypothetical protein